MLLMTIMMGTASSIPRGPHSQPQKSREMKTARLFILENRPVSTGVKRRPSILVMNDLKRQPLTRESWPHDLDELPLVEITRCQEKENQEDDGKSLTDKPQK